MVEFALVAVFFFVLLFGALEFGRLWYYSTHLGNSVRAAARYGAVLTDPVQAPAPVATIITNTQNYATAEITGTVQKPYLPATGIASVVTTVNDSDNNPVAGTAVHGNIITVTAIYNFEFLTGSFLNTTFNIFGTDFNFNIPTSIPLTRAASANYE